MAWARALVINRTHVATQNAIHVPFKLHMRDYMAKEEVLLDSGATHNFLDKRLVKRLGIGTKELAVPQGITNVDGTKNQDGTITRYTDLEVTMDEQTEIQRFY